MYIDMRTIVYLHCHPRHSSLGDDDHVAKNGQETPNSGGGGGSYVVLVAQDGVQHPPILFPKGTHLMQFLSCLESSLAPRGRLEPSLYHTQMLNNNNTNAHEFLYKLIQANTDGKIRCLYTDVFDFSCNNNKNSCLFKLQTKSERQIADEQ